MNSALSCEYQRLKRETLSLGWVRPGSLVTRFMPCGKTPCRCTATPPKLHGPYWQWSVNLHGKAVTRRLTREQARLCRAWQRNHRKLKQILHRMEALSLKETDRMLGKSLLLLRKDAQREGAGTGAL